MLDIILGQSKKNVCIMLCDQGKILDSLDYQKVYSLSEEIRKLLSKHVKNNDCIGLLLSHNIYIPSLIISCMSIKCPFVFLNELLNDTVSLLGLKWIITFKNSQIQDNFNLESVMKLRGSDELYLFRKSDVIEDFHHEYENILCVMMSSGTTGKNKNIQIENYCIENNVECLREKFAITSQDTVYCGTQLTFDPSLIEILLALSSGACLLITPVKTRLNPTTLYKTLFPPKSSEYKGITFLQIVPSVFKRWTIDQQKSMLSSNHLRVLALGGEMFPKEILEYDCAKELRIFNLYGITEVSCWASINEVNSKTEEISIGEELSETTIEIRDDFGEKVPNGEGEIYIGSSTRRCKVNNETLDRTQALFRSTGDLAKITPDGIFYTGRKNNIIKRFGHRVNLNTIEDIIFKETNLMSKCIWCKQKNKLVAFILLNESDGQKQSRILDKLRVKLLHSLPKEQFPDSLQIIPKFPLTSHGKINTRALEELYLKTLVKNDNLQNVKELFISLCCKYTGLTRDQLELYKNFTFLEIGGNSITAMQLLAEFKEITGSERLLTKLFEHNLDSCLNILKTSTTNPLKNYEIRLPKIAPRDHQEYEAKRKKYEKSMTVKWKYDFEACVDCSPIVFQCRNHTYVAVGSFSNIFAVLDATSGSEICKFVLPKSIENPCLASKNNTHVYFGCMDGKIYCIDYVQQKIHWSFETDGQIKCQPCFCNDDESAIIFGSYNKHLYCLNAEHGTVLWKTHVSESIGSNPLYDRISKRIYILTTLGTCLQLYSDSGKIEWKFCGDSPSFTSPKFSNSNSTDIIYGEAKGRVVCLTKSGQLKWSFQADGHVFSSIAMINRFITFGCNDGCFYVLEEKRDGFKLLYKMYLGGSIISTPFVYEMWDRCIAVVATQNGILHIVDIENREELAEYKLEGEIFSSPFVHENNIYIGCRDNYLYCFEVQ